MARETTRIDISDAPELLHLADEVRREGRSRVLTRNNEDLLVVSPIHRRRPKRKTVTEEDIAAALSASWEGIIDPEKLKQELDEARGERRPPVEL